MRTRYSRRVVVVVCDFQPSDDPGKWRMDPISEIPIALGATWGDVKPLVLRSGSQFRVDAPPAMNTHAYAVAFDEVKRLGGEGTVTPTERTDEQTSIGIFWAYDGTPSLCAPPRLYNQVLLTIADQMQTDFLDLTRLLAIATVAMADAGIAIWESKFFYQLWRPVTGIREADRGTDQPGTATAIVRRSATRRSARWALRRATSRGRTSRRYLSGDPRSFDKTEGIAQGRRVARYVARKPFSPGLADRRQESRAPAGQSKSNLG